MKIENSEERAAALLNWYEKSVRTFLEKQVPEQVAPLDEEAARLKGVLAQANETMVCFVGDSGVGKSTLLNAIVAGVSAAKVLERAMGIAAQPHASRVWLAAAAAIGSRCLVGHYCDGEDAEAVGAH